jgi:hypothetical protein
MSFYYLSFVDLSLPKGEQFVGATIVEATDDVEAFGQAWARNLIPNNCQIALLRLWTQTHPQVEIISADQLPNDALYLVNKFVPREAIIAQGHRPLGDEEYSIICDRHTIS